MKTEDNLILRKSSNIILALYDGLKDKGRVLNASNLTAETGMTYSHVSKVTIQNPKIFKRNEHDGRSYSIELTPKGIAIAKSLEAIRESLHG